MNQRPASITEKISPEPAHDRLLARPLSPKRKREGTREAAEDLLIKKGEARTLGVIKGDRERVTVGLRQKSCSIAGRNIKQRVHRKPRATLS